MNLPALTALAFGWTVGFGGARAAALAARRWWPRLLHVQLLPGLHINHYIWGIVLAVIVGTVMNGDGLRTGAALVLGVGFGMVIDEIAMLLYLEDIYFEPRGRLSLWVAGATSICLWLLAGLVWATRSRRG